MLRHVSVMLAAVLCLSYIPSDFAALSARAETLSGKCGDAAYWQFENGTLTIYGEGPMDNNGFAWSKDKPVWSVTTPWGSFKEEITEVIIEENITRIGGCAFWGCENLIRVTVPTSVLEIGELSFDGCTHLTDMTLPDSIQSIAPDLFTDCDAYLEQFRRDDGYTLINGWLMAEYPETDHVLRIPEGTKLIMSHVCEKADQIYEVICPESLRGIDSDAFYKCTNLMRVELNDGLERIGGGAFASCNRLTSLTIPASVTEIGALTENSLEEICGTRGTAAEQAAAEQGITFREISDQPPAATAFDYTADGWYFGNSAEAFGDTYYLTEEALAAVQARATKQNAYYENAWAGSCFGLAVTVLLAKNGLLPPEQMQAGAQSLSQVEPTLPVQSRINYYQAVQFFDTYRAAASEYRRDVSPIRIWRIQQAAKQIKNGGSPFLMEISIGGGGLHAVVGYGQESGSWQFEDKPYDSRILVWDPNFPEALRDDACLYYDSITLDYCIPYYNIYVAQDSIAESTGGIAGFCDDLSVLNAYPYPERDEPLRGDLNGDGLRTVADAVLLSRILAEDTSLTEVDLALADVNADGILTIMDLYALLRL